MSLASWLKQEPFTLTMSSGFFGFYVHAGMLAALLEQGLVPAKITGSSAGALVGACWASGLEMPAIKTALFSLQRDDFWDPALGLGLLKGVRFRAKLADFLVADQFEDCRVPLALSAFDLRARQTVVLCKGDLVSAVYASCAFPFLFQPYRINDSHCMDGGIQDRPGLAGVLPGERVLYHHISSKSPWRSKASKALQIPYRENLRAVALADMPRVGPNKLEMGPIAFDAAYHNMREILS